MVALIAVITHRLMDLTPIRRGVYFAVRLPAMIPSIFLYIEIGTWIGELEGAAGIVRAVGGGRGSPVAPSTGCAPDRSTVAGADQSASTATSW